jgi:hypothetical protein
VCAPLAVTGKDDELKAAPEGPSVAEWFSAATPGGMLGIEGRVIALDEAE